MPRIESHLEWQMTPHTDPAWNIRGCYITQITGDPMVYNKHMIFPAKGVDLSNPESFASIGMTVTGLAGAELDPGRRRGAPRDRHQQRPTAACLCGPLQT